MHGYKAFWMLVVSGASCLAEAPFEAREIVQERDRIVRDANSAARISLQKLLIRYEKVGDVNAVEEITKLLTSIPATHASEPSVKNDELSNLLGKWTARTGNASYARFLKEDGTFDSGRDGSSGTWELTDGKLSLRFNGGAKGVIDTYIYTPDVEVLKGRRNTTKQATFLSRD
ncbi:hypothetical protein [Roseibacillus persicicus]|uniref:hypothetical protein n=1 Tax=Roseibacillus persicicus TaxID=454148 RepID=UPI00280E40B5|nr:hypothetical protein [Roseibacillus persicicus]MDQ8192689.1 hypothetical protein [Roseibacillus persicicus]